MTGNLFVLIMGIIFSATAAGDIMIYLLIRKENPEDYVQDHPSEAGYYISEKKKAKNNLRFLYQSTSGLSIPNFPKCFLNLATFGPTTALQKGWVGFASKYP